MKRPWGKEAQRTLKPIKTQAGWSLVPVVRVLVYLNNACGESERGEQ
jgi:hypothetical protein